MNHFGEKEGWKAIIHYHLIFLANISYRCIVVTSQRPHHTGWAGCNSNDKLLIKHTG